MSKIHLTPFERMLLSAEDLIMTRLSPQGGPGSFLKWLFKVPILFHRLGIPVFSNFILLLTTRGRKSGKLRPTPLEYRREKETGNVIIMAGWGGKTDWSRNIQADRNVSVQIGRQKFDATAEPLTDKEVASFIEEAMRINPQSSRVWSRWAGEDVSIGSPQSILRAARYFPSFRLKPLQGSK